MNNTHSTRRVAGPEGHALSIIDLPRAGEPRWTVRKKALVVCAVQGGLISLPEARERYSLSLDEYLAWQTAYENGGLKALRIVRTFSQGDGGSRESVRGLPSTEPGFTGLESTLYNMLRQSEHVVTHELMLGAFYGPREGWRDKKIIDVLICKIRRKVPAEEGKIDCVWGRGYRFISARNE